MKVTNNVVHLHRPYAVEFMDDRYRTQEIVHIHAHDMDNADKQALDLANTKGYDVWAIWPEQ